MTVKRIKIRRRALNEAKAARLWYAERDPAVAARFLIALDEVLDRIEAVPGVGSQWPGLPELLRSPLQGFPYWVIYEDSGTGVLVIAIAHQKRRPDYWVDP